MLSVGAAALTVPTEPIVNDAKGALYGVQYGMKTWADILSPRQMLCLLSFTADSETCRE